MPALFRRDGLRTAVHCVRLNVRSLNLALALLLGASSTLSAAPNISRNPLNVTVTSGQNATLDVVATGTGTLTYQWRRSGFVIPGATTSTYVIGGATRASAGWYDVVVTDSTGPTTSSVARLMVAPSSYPTVIARDPARDLQLESAYVSHVNAVLASPDGGFFAVGAIASANGTRRSKIAHFNADGTVDASFVPAEIIGYRIEAIAQQADGKVLVGGMFAAVAGRTRNGLARLNADGSLDTGFDAGFAASGGSTAVAVQSDGKIVVAGWGGNGPVLRRLNADGTRDEAYRPNVQGTVYAFALQPDGCLLMAGAFTVTGAGITREGLARLKPDGSLDASFDAGIPDRVIQMVVVAPDGKLYIVGRFTSIGGTSAKFVARLTSGGAVDTGFSPVLADIYGSADIEMYAVAIEPDGKVVIGGGFDLVNGVLHPTIARLNPDGSLDSGLYPDPCARVCALAVLRDGSVVAGTSAVEPTAGKPYGLAHYKPDGSLDARVDFFLKSEGHPGPVIPMPDGAYIIAGDFDSACGIATRGVLRLKKDGSFDSSFIVREGAQSMSGRVTCAFALPDGRILIGGSVRKHGDTHSYHLVLLKGDGTVDRIFSDPFSDLYDVVLTPAGKIVAVGSDAANSSLGLVKRFNLDGTPDVSFAGGSFDSIARTVLALPDGGLVVGGYFSSYQGQRAGYVVRLHDDGTLDTTFSANTHFDRAITDAAIDLDGKLIVAGHWFGPDGVYSGIVRLNPNGTRDSSFVDTAGDWACAVLVQEDGRIITRRDVYSSSGPNGYLQRLNANGSVDTSFKAAGLFANQNMTRSSLAMMDNGQLLVSDVGGGWEGTFYETAPSGVPELLSAPASQVLGVGSSVTLTSSATSLLPLSYQWLFNGTPIADATNASYSIDSLKPADVGGYSVRVTNEFGTITSPTATVSTPLFTNGHLQNLSIRTNVGAGDSTVILGVGVGGAGTYGVKPLVYRAVGPTLATTFKLATALGDPVLELFDAASFKIDQNDDWTGTFDLTSVGAFPFAGTNPKDAAIYNPFAPIATQTVHVVSKNGAPGIVLAEVFDATPDDALTVTTPRLVNGSARATVGQGDDVMILGFVIGGRTSVRVLVRAAGPTLAATPFNVAGVVADPQLTIYTSDGASVAANDNWADAGQAAAMTATFDSVGAFHFASATSKDAAVVATLLPGAYTAVVRGVGNTSGVALVELYELP